MTRSGHPPVDNVTARKSALLVAAVLLSLAAWNWYRGRLETSAVLGALGALLLAIGLFVPPLARRFHDSWMRLAGVLGYINSRILLSIMYYAVITPIGILTRICGRNPMNRRGQGQSSYWVPRTTPRQTRESFERSF